MEKKTMNITKLSTSRRRSAHHEDGKECINMRHVYTEQGVMELTKCNFKVSAV